MVGIEDPVGYSPLASTPLPEVCRILLRLRWRPDLLNSALQPVQPVLIVDVKIPEDHGVVGVGVLECDLIPVLGYCPCL